MKNTSKNLQLIYSQIIYIAKYIIDDSWITTVNPEVLWKYFWKKHEEKPLKKVYYSQPLMNWKTFFEPDTIFTSIKKIPRIILSDIH